MLTLFNGISFYTLDFALWFISYLLILQIINFYVFKNILSKNIRTISGISLTLAGLYIAILFSNIFGVFVNFYRITISISFVFLLRLCIFLSIFWIALTYDFTRFFPHKVSDLRIKIRRFILSTVELFSYWIRPITLTLRLIVNLLIGHLILNLLSVYLGPISLITGSIFIFYELIVAILQTYIFITLLQVYHSPLH